MQVYDPKKITENKITYIYIYMIKKINIREIILHDRQLMLKSNHKNWGLRVVYFKQKSN